MRLAPYEEARVAPQRARGDGHQFFVEDARPVAREAHGLRQPEAPAAHVEGRAPVLCCVRLLQVSRGEVDGEAPLVVPVWQRAAPAERKGTTLDAAVARALDRRAAALAGVVAVLVVVIQPSQPVRVPLRIQIEGVLVLHVRGRNRGLREALRREARDEVAAFTLRE